MKRTFLKTVFKDLKRNISRFVAIIAIVGLGVGLLIGLLSSTPDLQYSANEFYNETNIHDILIKSTVGFSDDDIKKLKVDLNSASYVEGYHQNDYEIVKDEQKVSVRLIAGDIENGNIDKIKLIKGKYPSNKNECVVLNRGIYSNIDCLNESVSIDGKDYKIVGICDSSVYYYKIYEPSTVGSGILDTVIYIDSTYHSDLPITDVVITTNNKSSFRFDQEYFNSLSALKKEIEDNENNYLESRFEELKTEAFNQAYPLVRASYELEIRKKIDPTLPIEVINQIVEAELLNSEADIIKAANEIVLENTSDISLDWYILDLKSNASYVAFKSNSKKVDDIAIVFPFFFFFIAALIALTSITRMVSEDRSNIGTLKSLGYSNKVILSKYLFYALFACAIGSILGILLGVYLLPYIIYGCYDSLFVMPKGYFNWNALAVSLSTIAMTATIFLVMIFVCLRSLKEKPNCLLVPKAPKPGKRILLERIGFIWKHLKFKHKSALRNVFRFKRNLIMMIVGVGGCTGLMLVALGLNDSLASLSKDQYDTVIKYDFKITTEQAVDLSFLSDSKSTYVYEEKGTASADSEYEIEIIYADSDINEYIGISENAFNTGDVIISRQLYEKFNLKKGSLFNVSIESESKEYKISGVFDNYIGNYIIINSPKEETNQCLIKLGRTDKENYNSIVSKIYSLPNVSQINDMSQTRKTYDSMTESTTLIVYVIILFSGALAVIVIYNLTNININERIKEIATLKVLGYQPAEVLGYVYREITFMSILGILFGFVLGVVLNIFVMNKLSSPGQYFSASINPLYFLYAALITIAFVLLVFVFFIDKFKKIKMVESLKCVD